MAKDIGKVLKAGKAFKGALREAKDGRGSSKAVDLEVPLNTEFCGTTLRKLMKAEGITREEATAVFLAWQASCEEQGLPSGPTPKAKAPKAADTKTRVTGKRPPSPEQPATKKPKKAKAEDPGPDPMVFAPASAQDVADFFGTEKENVLKNKKQESANEVEDLDGEPWDENEGLEEDWEDSGDWEEGWEEGWEGSTDEYDWEAEYPGFWDAYWEHKYGDGLEAKLEALVDGQEQALALSCPAGPAEPKEGTTQEAASTPTGPAEPEERTTGEAASTPTGTPCMPHDPSQADTQPLDTEMQQLEIHNKHLQDMLRRQNATSFGSASPTKGVEPLSAKTIQEDPKDATPAMTRPIATPVRAPAPAALPALPAAPAEVPQCSDPQEPEVKEKNKVLRKFISHGQNCKACEAELLVLKEQSLTGGGEKDEHSPDNLSLTRFWVVVDREKTEMEQSKIRAQIKVNAVADEAFMAGLGSNGLPSVLHRSAPATAAHPLNGDVLKAFDKYNTGLQEAAAAACGLSELCECNCGLIKFVLRCYVPPKGNASGAGRGKAPKKRAGAKSVASAATTKTRASLLNEVFRTDEDKHQRWSF
ncbi:unnamed protein product [Symbiodinium sp. CCMP2592]|nr:unnamed protein product [Symbiodinium sp. CCMP2592]CAE7404073.1 unnamed protein product [Symbiodinium sp. CCMP2592]